MRDQIGPIDYDEWCQNYYLNPRPEIVPKYLGYLRSTGELTKSQNYWLFLGIFSALFARHPNHLANWLADWTAYGEDDQRTMLEAVWFSSTPSGRSFLESVGSSRLIALFGKDLTEVPQPDIINQPVTDGGQLDYFWGRFFISGNEKYVRKVISCLPLLNKPPKTPDGMVDAAPMFAGGAAKWSISANAYRHARVLAICRNEQKQSSGATSEILEEIIETIESGEWESAANARVGRKKSWWQFWK